MLETIDKQRIIINIMTNFLPTNWKTHDVDTFPEKCNWIKLTCNITGHYYSSIPPKGTIRHRKLYYKKKFRPKCFHWWILSNT